MDAAIPVTTTVTGDEMSFIASNTAIPAVIDPPGVFI